MEVSLVEANALPEGCLVSISCGTSCQQAPAEVGKFKLCFPASSSHLKVQVLAPIASATLDLEPQQELYSLSAENRSSGQARLKFCVQEAKSLGKSQKAEKVNELRAEARLNLLKASTDGRLGEILSEAQTQAATTAPNSLEEARAVVREALEKSALDGRLQKALSENQESPALPLRAQIEKAVPSLEPLVEELRKLQAEQKERKEQLAHLIELKKLKREQRLLQEEQRLFAGAEQADAAKAEA